MSSSPEYEPMLTPAEVSVIFRCDTKTISRWAKQGKIHAIRTLGGHRRFYEKEVSALMRGQTWEPPGGWPPEPDQLAAPLRTLWPAAVTGLAATVRNRLQTSGVATVRELTALTAGDLKDIGLRPPQVDEVRLALHRKGLTLRGEVIGDAA
jgi:excisionase family DNA binding protein